MPILQGSREKLRHLPRRRLLGGGLLLAVAVTLIVASLVHWTATPPEATTDEAGQRIADRSVRIDSEAMLSLPSNVEAGANGFKPGHWFQVRHALTAKQQDEAVWLVNRPVDRDGQPLPIVGSDVALEFASQSLLPKDERKSLTAPIMIAAQSGEEEAESLDLATGSVTIELGISQQTLGLPIASPRFFVAPMPDNQYFLPILAKDPQRLADWVRSTAVMWPSEIEAGGVANAPSRVLLVPEQRCGELLPDHFLFWSATSHLVVLDADLNKLSANQQTALTDWLHFGGQIIISGPDALPCIPGSPLEDWLPLVELEPSRLFAQDLEPLNQHWHVPSEEYQSQPLTLPPESQIPLLRGSLNGERSSWLDGATGLIAERRIGRGRVVMTTLSLDSPWLTSWPSYGSMVNGGLLRRPPRAIRYDSDGRSLGLAGQLAGQERAAGWFTWVRLAARDFRPQLPAFPARVNYRPEPWLQWLGAADATGRSVGGWDGSSRLVQLALRSLRQASGIVVPKVDTILKLLAGYLLILVPINWIIFRSIGRVELAWLAAPLIAVAGAIWVARSVQLDIGFSRSQARLNLLEMHADYPRGHQTSLLSLYTSLTTRYGLWSENEEGLLLPAQLSGSARRISQLWTARLQHASPLGQGYSGYRVLSNTTGLLRGEEMCTLSGAFSGRAIDSGRRGLAWEIDNRSGIDLRSAAIVAMDDRGRRSAGWIGELESGQRRASQLAAVAADDVVWFEAWDADPYLAGGRPDPPRAPAPRSPLPPMRPAPSDTTQTTNAADTSTAAGSQSTAQSRQSVATASDTSARGPSLGAVLGLLVNSRDLRPGATWLIGWTDQPVGGLRVKPAAGEQSEATLVLVHLSPEQVPPAAPDMELLFPPPEEAEIDPLLDAPDPDGFIELPGLGQTPAPARAVPHLRQPREVPV